MKKIKWLIIMLLISFSCNILYSQDTIIDESDFDYFKSKSKILMKLEDDRNVRLEKLSWVGYKIMMLYTIENDTTNVYVDINDFSRNSTWKNDTLAIKAWNGASFFNHNLAIFDVVQKKGSNFIQIFSGKDTTYTISIKNQYDIKSQFSRVSGYHLGKVTGATYDWSNNIMNAYFNTNSKSLINKRTSDIDYLYKISSNSHGAYWSVPEYVLKHNNVSFKSCSFARRYVKKKSINYVVFGSDKNEVPYLSINNDGDNKWSYPVKFSSTISGHGHKLFINKDMAYIVFYRTDQNTGIDEMIVWYGSLRNFEKGCVGGRTVQATMNYRFKNLSKSEILEINSSMNLEVIPLKGKKIFAAISAKWREGMPNYILGFEIHEKRLRLD